MVAYERRYERAQRDDLEAAVAYVVEGIARERAPDPLTLAGRIDLGVEEGDPVAVQPVAGEAGEGTIDQDVVARLARVVTDFDRHSALRPSYPYALIYPQRVLWHGTPRVTAVLRVGGLHYASEKSVVEQVLGRRPGVVAVEANPVAQTATVTYDPAETSVEELRLWVEKCGSHCAGKSVPGHVCDPLADGAAARAGMAHDHAAMERAGHAHGHGHGHGHGGHAGMSMEAMARDMRNRFLVALVFTIPTVAWSMVGSELLGTELATPFDIDRDVWQFLLRLPIVLWASSIFFTGAVAALRARTLDMMVLVAVAIGVGWLYSVAATFFIEGEVFYEAAGMLATFVLLGHWFEMRARGGANDAIRALLDLAPPKAVVIRDGEPVELPTAEVVVGDLLLVRPGAKCPSTRRSRRGRAFSTSRRSRARACRSRRRPATSSRARRSTRTARCAPAPSPSARTRRSLR
jgi:copper chaperone CopZ